METLKAVIDAVNGVIWGWPSASPIMVVTLLGAGIFLTLRLGFINLRGFRHAVRVVRGDYDDPDDPGDISHFQALTTALSATVGIGNIAGVATAIHYGGPGALFWMWVTAFFGMTTKYTECTLATHYRRDNPDGSVSGGPMYYIEKGLGPMLEQRLGPLGARLAKVGALFFAACAVTSSFGSGNGVQAFTMADSFRSDFGLPTTLTAGISAVIVGLVIIGGIKRIGSFASKVMPTMAVLYFIAAVVVLAMRITDIPDAFATIFASAFSPAAAIAGFSGATFALTLRWGVKRGLFSNEAGQGSAPIAHAAAKTDEPVREGAVALLEPFVDTLVICTLTGLMIVTTGVWKETRTSEFELKSQSAITVVSGECAALDSDGEVPRTCTLDKARLPIQEGRIIGGVPVITQTVVTDAIIKKDGQPVSGTLVVKLKRDPRGKKPTIGEAPRVLDANGRQIKGAKMVGKVLQNGSPLTAWALQRGLEPIFPFGNFIVTFSVFLFALSTAIGWSYYGDRSAQYLLGEKAIIPYRLLYVVMHFVGGAVASLEGIWGFGDAALGMMSFPNLATIILLSGTVVRLTREYFSREHIPFKDRK